MALDRETTTRRLGRTVYTGEHTISIVLFCGRHLLSLMQLGLVPRGNLVHMEDEVQQRIRKQHTDIVIDEEKAVTKNSISRGSTPWVASRARSCAVEAAAGLYYQRQWIALFQ